MRKLLFIGDSITESGIQEDPENLGNGYVRLIHEYLRVTYPTSTFEVINKGVGGNRITDLASRWKNDVLDGNPDLVSVSIGINDVWRQLDQPHMEQVSPTKFNYVYEEIIQQLKHISDAELILMEPTIIQEDVNSIGNKKLAAYVKIVRQLGEKYHANVVATNVAFLDYLQAGNKYALTVDGVHMNTRGNVLMAKSWLKDAEDICLKIIKI